MSLKIECHLKWNVTQNRMSLKKECHLKQNVTQMEKIQIGLLSKMECHLNQIRLKTDCHSKWNVTQN